MVPSPVSLASVQTAASSESPESSQGMSTSQGKSFGHGALEEQLCLLRTIDLLASPQQASCFQECYFVKRGFLEAVCLIPSLIGLL